MMAVDPFVSVKEEILRIRKANAQRNPWGVLGIPPTSTYKQIKSAQRKWIRKLHPDRWYACTDEHLRNEIQEAFYQMQAAYSESVKQCWARLQGANVQQGPLTTPAPEPAIAPKGLFGWLQKIFSFLHFTPNTSTSG